MKNIEVDKIIDPISASDGAGVKLKRSIGVEPNYFDPFLMLDEFGSETVIEIPVGTGFYSQDPDNGGGDDSGGSDGGGDGD